MSVEVHDALQDRVESISAQGACASDVDGMEDPGILVCNAGRLVTRKDLLTGIWESEHVNDSGYLRLYISQLRKKIEDDPSRPKYLKTEQGTGCRLDLPSAGK